MDFKKKESWIWALNTLNKYYREFTLNYKNSETGGNQKTRKAAKEVVNGSILSSVSIIRDNPELKSLFLDGAVGQYSAEKFEELRIPKYFNYDMPQIINAINVKIDEWEE